jgi:hypothetical protein
MTAQCVSAQIEESPYGLHRLPHLGTFLLGFHLFSHRLEGSKLRCMRSTPTEMQSINENDFECFAKTGVNTRPMAKTTDDGQTFNNPVVEELPTIRQLTDLKR